MRSTPRILSITLAGVMAAIVLAAIVGPSTASAFPKPSVYPISWQYKFEYNAPKRIAVRTPGQDVAKGYWYITFTITNKNIEDPQVKFLPVFEMLTREGNVIRSDKEIPPNVYEEIARREGRKLEPLDTMRRTAIRLGDDEARDGVAVWPEAMARMGTFSLFFGGLSGETIYLDKEGKVIDTADWLKFTEDEKKAFITMQKTLQVTYIVPGDELFPGEDAVNFVKQDWIMR